MRKKVRAKVFLDSVDMEIMRKLKDKPVGIMELKEKIGMKHKNLKYHITRLHDRQLIIKKPVLKSRKVILSVSKKKKAQVVYRMFK